MATSLLISYPDIPLRATMTTSSAAESGYTAFDTITGPRELIYKRTLYHLVFSKVSFKINVSDLTISQILHLFTGFNFIKNTFF